MNTQEGMEYFTIIEAIMLEQGVTHDVAVKIHDEALKEKKKRAIRVSTAEKKYDESFWDSLVFEYEIYNTQKEFYIALNGHSAADARKKLQEIQDKQMWTAVQREIDLGKDLAAVAIERKLNKTLPDLFTGAATASSTDPNHRLTEDPYLGVFDPNVPYRPRPAVIKKQLELVKNRVKVRDALVENSRQIEDLVREHSGTRQVIDQEAWNAEEGLRILEEKHPDLEWESVVALEIMNEELGIYVSQEDYDILPQEYIQEYGLVPMDMDLLQDILDESTGSRKIVNPDELPDGADVLEGPQNSIVPGLFWQGTDLIDSFQFQLTTINALIPLTPKNYKEKILSSGMKIPRLSEDVLDPEVISSFPDYYYKKMESVEKLFEYLDKTLKEDIKNGKKLNIAGVDFLNDLELLNSVPPAIENALLEYDPIIGDIITQGFLSKYQVSIAHDSSYNFFGVALLSYDGPVNPATVTEQRPRGQRIPQFVSNLWLPETLFPEADSALRNKNVLRYLQKFSLLERAGKNESSQHLNSNFPECYNSGMSAGGKKLVSPLAKKRSCAASVRLYGYSQKYCRQD